MHTFEKDGVLIHHNSDFSGDVDICIPGTVGGLRVSADVLLAFAAEYVKSKRIEEIHNAGHKEILS